MKLVLGSILISALVGCGGDRGGPVPLEELAARYADAVCDWGFRCCDGVEIGFTSLDECRAVLGLQFEDWVDEQRGALATGRVAYDGDGAAECLADLAAATCTGFEAVGAACVIFVGQVQPGGTCNDPDECTGGGFCDRGACVAPPGVGAECVGEQCGDGAYCYTRTPMDPPGPLYTCRALEPDGATCAGDHQCAGGHCDDLGRCGPESAEQRCDGV